jgi:GT2 family glycosyltransferase
MIFDALGAQAGRIAHRIGGEAAIVACEPAFAGAALDRALALRREGTHFFLSVHAADTRELRVRELSARFATMYATGDEARLMLDGAVPEIAQLRPTLAETDASALIEAIRLSDGIIVQSMAEYGRLRAMLGPIPRSADIVINLDPDVPSTIAGAPTDIVVYAPWDRGNELATFIVALADVELPVTFVALDAPTIPGRARFVPPEEAAEALGRARVIVDASRNDPGAALALAKLGRPLVISSRNGASEALRNVGTYEYWERRSILAAVLNALGGPLPHEKPHAWVDRPPIRPEPVFDASAPLVSIVVSTYNRPELLAETLASIERQTYPNLEIIVVNDAGSDVKRVVPHFARARLLNQPENRGPAAARNRGLADARGEYVQFFDDDDEMFPDHVATLATALTRSGLDVAYGQMINAIVTPAGDGTYHLESLAGSVSLLDHADIQWAGSIATTSLMFRRSLIERIGNVDETQDAAEDYEFWLRLATGREWARSPDITSLYFIRKDGSNRSSVRARRYATAHRAIYAKHPSARPLIAAGRAAMLEYFGGAIGPSG